MGASLAGRRSLRRHGGRKLGPSPAPRLAYRNWVIGAFARDLPYDQFVREQIAGDLLVLDGPTEQYADRVIATGYLAIARRFGHDIEKDVHLTLEDTLDTLGKSILGLSIGCCRCHDHKYDPLTAHDYYGLYGIFASTKFAFPGCEPQQRPRDLVPLVSPTEYQRLVQASAEKIPQATTEVARLAEQQTAQATRLKASLAAMRGCCRRRKSTTAKRPKSPGAQRPWKTSPCIAARSFNYRSHLAVIMVPIARWSSSRSWNSAAPELPLERGGFA